MRSGKRWPSDQQAILFLNRRGNGHLCLLPRLRLHARLPALRSAPDLPSLKDGRSLLICHYCGYQRGMPSQMPAVRQRADPPVWHRHREGRERGLKSVFPEARILRWDAETTRQQRFARDILLSHFINHRADILVGTQMLAKGLDLPLVTLVGVILAEVGLNLPDYRANERTFQLLTQVAGRAGRSPLGGKVILQSFQPEHYAIQAASRHDYEGFYNTELYYRKRTGYPPFSRLLRLEYRHEQAAQAEAAARGLAAQIQQWLKAGDFRATEMIGPVPSFFGKLKGLYRWQILLRGPNPLQVVKGQTLEGWRVEVDPPNLL